jgi:hypothetical protein
VLLKEIGDPFKPSLRYGGGMRDLIVIDDVDIPAAYL